VSHSLPSGKQVGHKGQCFHLLSCNCKPTESWPLTVDHGSGPQYFIHIGPTFSAYSLNPALLLNSSFSYFPQHPSQSGSRSVFLSIPSANLLTPDPCSSHPAFTTRSQYFHIGRICSANSLNPAHLLNSPLMSSVLNPPHIMEAGQSFQLHIAPFYCSAVQV